MFNTGFPKIVLFMK